MLANSTHVEATPMFYLSDVFGMVELERLLLYFMMTSAENGLSERAQLQKHT